MKPKIHDPHAMWHSFSTRSGGLLGCMWGCGAASRPVLLVSISREWGLKNEPVYLKRHDRNRHGAV